MTHKTSDILYDGFGRFHDYLRISFIEKCNLRCAYCMPEHGVKLSPRRELMTASEVIEIAKVFISEGVQKIRLTGGEPLLRKDFEEIITGLSETGADLSLTTNAYLVDRYIDALKMAGLRNINVSLDSMDEGRFKHITKRDAFHKTLDNIHLLLDQGFNLKLNVVLLKGQNDHEILDFVHFTQSNAIAVRFIEFMPFEGNLWDKEMVVTEDAIMQVISDTFSKENIIQLPTGANSTSTNYRIKGFKGAFGYISTVTKPFCDSCNRLRISPTGKIKNCLFSKGEIDLLTAYREGKDIRPFIKLALMKKKKVRAGLDSHHLFENVENHSNESMVQIGG